MPAEDARFGGCPLEIFIIAMQGTAEHTGSDGGGMKGCKGTPQGIFYFEKKVNCVCYLPPALLSQEIAFIKKLK